MESEQVSPKFLEALQNGEAAIGAEYQAEMIERHETPKPSST
jgi:hypothetical protein